MRAEAPGPRTEPLGWAEGIIARGEAHWEKVKRGEVKLSEEEPAGQTQDPQEPTLANLNLVTLDYGGE